MPVIVYCSNCGKEIRRTPALVKKNRTGRFFCNQDCTNAWWEKNGGYANTGCPKKERAVEMAAKTFPIGEPVHIWEIAARVRQQPGKYNLKNAGVARYLTMGDYMALSAPGVWVRVDPAEVAA